MKNRTGLIEIIAAVVVFGTGILDPKWAANIAIIIFLGLGVWRKNAVRERKIVNKGQVDQKRKNLEKIEAFLEDRDAITNNDVEKLLVVSNATAERYLDELEKEGKLTQIGRAGRTVSYRRR